MSYKIAISKTGKNVLTITDPNDFIFNSDYNTFKIIATGTITQVVNFASPTIQFAHGLSYIPLVHCFMKADTNDEAVPPNFMWLQTGVYYFVGIDTVSADATNVYIPVRQFNAFNVTIKIRYYIFEVPL